MTKQIKSTYNEFIESLSKKEREEFEQEYKDHLLSEMIIAAMEQDEISVRKLAKLADISPTIIQEMRSGAKKTSACKAFLKF